MTGQFNHISGRCRLADDHGAGPSAKTGWSIRRAVEANQPEIARFCTRGVRMADDHDIDAQACLSARPANDRGNAAVTWFALDGETVVGVISLWVQPSGVARVAELCIAPDQRGTALTAELLRFSLRYCRNAGVLKVVLSTHLPQEEAWQLLGECGFDFGRHRRRNGRNVMEYYLNLYQQPDCEQTTT